MHKQTWTPERIALVNRLLSENKTRSEIASALGVSIQSIESIIHRNSVSNTTFRVRALMPWPEHMRF